MKTITIDGKNYTIKSQAAVDQISTYLSGKRFQQIPTKTPEEVEKLKKAGNVCANVLDEISPHIRVGVTRKELNDIILDLVRNKHHAEPDRLVSDAQTDAGARISACFGHNNIIVNAEPNEETLKPGDIFGIDISVKKDGWCGDTRKTWLLGEEVSPTVLSLYAVSNRAMWLAIGMVKEGAKVSDIAKRVESYANENGFAMIKLPITCGHSLGQVHMDGWLVPLYNCELNEGRILKEGMVITIETFMSAGNGDGYILENDVGSAITQDGAPACYWEHALVVTKTGCEVLDLRTEEKAEWAHIAK